MPPGATLPPDRRLVDDATFRAIVDFAVSPYGIVDDDGTIRWVSTSMGS